MMNYYYASQYGPWGPHVGLSFTHGLLFPFLLALPFLIVIVAWTLFIKGYALWTAARRGEKWWFIALLVVNTLGLLELFYLFVIVGKRMRKAPAVTSSEPAENK